MSNLIPVSDWCRHKAVFFDDNGVCVGQKRLKYSDSTFVFQGRGFNFMPLNSSFFKVVNIFSKTKFYFYNINNPMPLLIKKSIDPVVNSEAYGVFLRTDILKKLNDLSKKNWLSELLTPRNMIIALILIVVIWFFASGHSLSELSSVLSNSGGSK